MPMGKFAERARKTIKRTARRRAMLAALDIVAMRLRLGEREETLQQNKIFDDMLRRYWVPASAEAAYPLIPPNDLGLLVRLPRATELHRTELQRARSHNLELRRYVFRRCEFCGEADRGALHQKDGWLSTGGPVKGCGECWEKIELAERDQARE